MLLIGLLILLVAVLFILYVVTGADGSTTLEAFNVSTTMPALTLFLSGMVSLLAIGLGLWLMTAGARRNARHRKEHKVLERDAREARTLREHGTTRRDHRAPETEVPYGEYQEERPLRSGERLDGGDTTSPRRDA
ncbi:MULTISPECIES: hypothetical protein [Kytococcus]|uniref:hypothetical protein n=1 Tax=Kytococcus TaxID=57499 RepID=UPI0008A4A197|nr:MULTISPECIES: hypothetical protein [Kytococcus]OFS14636.1 hypothetical protein HMPREF3099_03725 [Kytococcus sp. HMSC28H12]